LPVTRRASLIRRTLLDYQNYCRTLKNRLGGSNPYENVEHYSIALHQLPENSDTSILDVGCGPGYFLKFLESLGYVNLHGIDIHSQKNWSDSDKINFVCADARHSTRFLKPQSFDLILALNLFHK